MTIMLLYLPEQCRYDLTKKGPKLHTLSNRKEKVKSYY